MPVLIDKSVCPHASGQRTAMHVCDERWRGVGHPPPALITHMHGCPLSRCMRTDRLVDEDGHGWFSIQYVQGTITGMYSTRPESLGTRFFRPDPNFRARPVFE